MPNTALDYSQQIITQLKALIPDLSLDPITPERKIVDTLADILATASIDPYVLNYQLDIDTKVGSDLDNFVALFGFARQAGRKATGTVTFSRNSPATADILISAGTNIIAPATSVSNLVTFVTINTVVLPIGATSVDASIQCTDNGPSGNVPANTITQLASNSTGTDISAVTNTAATSGGSNSETDADLRIRFKNTIFRNISGTRDQFLALALATVFSNKANVIGPVSRFIEYVQIPPSLSLASIINYSKYTYNFNYYLTNGSSVLETFYNPGGIDYTFTASVPPVITVNNTTNLPVNGVFLLEHAYCSLNSRNDPANNILNFIDVFVSGEDDTSAIETTQLGTNLFSSTSTDPNYNQNWIRVNDNSNPIVGNTRQQVIWQPLDTIPSIITINSTDYYEGIHYWQIRDVSKYMGSKNAQDGIEWTSSAAANIGATTTYTLSYTFNKLPIILNELMDLYKQITSDVLVHTARLRYFIINLIVMYTPGFVKSDVDNAISLSLTNFMQSQQFGSIIQISDILELAHEVSGVDNIRLATTGDGVPYGIQEVTAMGTPLGLPLVNDFELQDSDLPILDSVVTTQKSQNTWT